MSAEVKKPPITPETKVGDLLAHYPDLEGVLLDTSPTYQALKNPVLRRTVGKVATLRQVATVGNISLGALIGRLRAAAGQEGEELPAEAEGAESARPAWAHSQGVWRSFDARPILETGAHPMQRVMQDLMQAVPGQVYELITPFVPAPLIEMAQGRGFLAYTDHEEPEVVRTFFTRE